MAAEAIDLANVGKPMSQTALEEMHALKTGAMFEAAVIRRHCWRKKMTNHRRAVGLCAEDRSWCFRWWTMCSTPRPTAPPSARRQADDAANDKPTFVSLMGIDAARAYADRLTHDAVAALPAHLNNDRLAALARAMAQRTA